MYLSQVKLLSQQHQHFQKKHRKKTPKKHLKKAEVLGKDDGIRVTRNYLWLHFLLSSAYSSLKREIRQGSETLQALYEMLGFINELCNGCYPKMTETRQEVAGPARLQDLGTYLTMGSGTG